MESAQLRQRNPFKFLNDLPEIDQDNSDRVLDEQEQEQVIETLERDSEAISRRYRQLGLSVILFSTLWQLLYLIRVIGPSDGVTSLFGLLHLFLQGHLLCQLLRISTVKIGDLSIMSTPPFLFQSLLLAYPIISVMLHKEVDVPFVLVPGFASLVTWICLEAIDTAKKEIKELEELKYDAKGA
ncbi:hypothetical protein CPB86DRAFT_813849 [Serendipita vermifera]|nr:hypothetical protein CPB86DRAFT_813849 [Serendipita vermifera]